MVNKILKSKGADILHALPFISSRSLCQKVINSHQTPCKLFGKQTTMDTHLTVNDNIYRDAAA